MKITTLCLAAALAALPAGQSPRAQAPSPGAPTQAQIVANFDRADADRDGKLTRQEFLNTPRGKAPNDPEQSFAASDLDKDGAVSKAEFVSLQGINIVTQPAPAAK